MLDLPSNEVISVLRKILKLVEKYNKHLTNAKRVAVDIILNVFVITNADRNLLCREDEIFYKNQILSGGRIGFVAGGDEQKKNSSIRNGFEKF